LLVREREAEPPAAVLFAALEIVQHAREERGAPPPSDPAASSCSPVSMGPRPFFAVEIDRVCFYGTGTPPQPRGLRTTTNVNDRWWIAARP
jgi:hypothetical protein